MESGAFIGDADAISICLFRGRETYRGEGEQQGLDFRSILKFSDLRAFRNLQRSL